MWQAIAAIVKGVVEGGLSFVNKSQTTRAGLILDYQEERDKGSVSRNLPLMIFTVVAIVLIIIMFVKK